MRTQVVEVREAVGRLLSSPIFHPSGKKLLAKGHLVSEEDIQLLYTEGHHRVSTVVLEDEDIPEDEAAIEIARYCGAGSMEIVIGAGGRANLHATEDCCLNVNEVALQRLNRSGVVTAATLPSLSFAAAGQRVGTVKTAPFAVPRTQFRNALEDLKEHGPCVAAESIREPSVAVLYCDPIRAERARDLFESIMRTRLERFHAGVSFVLATREDEKSVARGLEHLLRLQPTFILVASTTAPAGPEDAVGRAMIEVGCHLESFLAPVEPGNLLLLSYVNDIPVVSAPGCYRSPKPNVVDLILPALLAGRRLHSADISALGHGGLLQ